MQSCYEDFETLSKCQSTVRPLNISMLLPPSVKEEAPLDEGTGRGPVADSTYQASWELRKWSDPGNESLGLTTGQHEGTHRSRYDL